MLSRVCWEFLELQEILELVAYERSFVAEDTIIEKQGKINFCTVSSFAGSKFCIGGQDPNILCVRWKTGCATGNSTSISCIKGWGEPLGIAGPLDSEVRANPRNSLLSQGWCSSSSIWYAKLLSEQWISICQREKKLMKGKTIELA